MQDPKARAKANWLRAFNKVCLQLQEVSVPAARHGEPCLAPPLPAPWRPAPRGQRGPGCPQPVGGPTRGRER